jgi:WD40 repeat protein/predicted Ser/Thr protein kinase
MGCSTNRLAEVEDQNWSVLRDAVRTLEESWRTGSSSGFVDLLPSADHPFRQRVLIELIKVDQEFRWRSQNPRLLEDYLTQWGELSSQAEVVRELLEAECTTRTLCGDMPTSTELQQRFGECGAEIDLAAIAEEVRGESPPRPSANALIDTSGQAAELTPADGHLAQPLAIGQVFGRYQIRSLLGEGGMGWVYRAYDEKLDREIALKIPRFDPSFDPQMRERFVQEAKTAAKIEHPNICPIYDADALDGTYFIAMKLVEGRSLVEWMKDRRISGAEAARIVLKLADALEAVHRAGIVHRDIKPSNVMLDAAEEPQLMDFGLARTMPPSPDVSQSAARAGSVLAALADSAGAPVRSGPPGGSLLTASGLRSGTLPYMSCEQLEGQAVDGRSDVYSLGVLLYQILTGKLPFAGTPDDMLDGIRHAAPPKLCASRPDLDPALERICLKALGKNPADRYSSAQEMAGALRQYAARPPWRRWWKVLTGLAGFALVLFLGIVIKVETDYGIAEITIEPPDVQAEIIGEEIRVHSPRDEIGLRIGKHYLIVNKDGFYTESRCFTVTRGGREEIKVRLLPKPNLSPQKDELEPPARQEDQRLADLPVKRWIETLPCVSGIWLSRDNTTLYAAIWENHDQSRVQMLDFLTGVSKKTLPFGSHHTHSDVALSADERFLFTDNYYMDYISRIDLQKQNARRDLEIGGQWAGALATTPDRQKLVVAYGEDGRNVDENNDGVAVIDIAGDHFERLANIVLPDEPQEHKIGVSGDSRFAYLISIPRKSAAPRLYEIQLEPPYKIARTLDFPNSELMGIAVSSKTNQIFVSDKRQKKIWTVDRQTWDRKVISFIDGYAPEIIALNHAENLLAALCPKVKKAYLVRPADGTTLAQITKLRNNARDLVFSAGDHNLLIADGSDRGGVAVVDVRLLAYDIVFASDREGESQQLYRFNAAARQLVRLRKNSATERSPRWSPDGQSIAFLSDVGGATRICLMDTAGKEKARFEETIPSVDIHRFGALIDWSPDGRQIAFVAANKDAIRAVDVSSGHVTTLKSGEIEPGYACIGGLCWRRSDNKIVFSCQNPASSEVQDIFVLDPQNGKVAKLTHRETESRYWTAPCTTAAGNTAALEIDPDAPQKSRLVELGADGGTARVLVENVPALMMPAWSPDGKYLCYLDGQNQLVFYDINHRETITLVEEKGDLLDPDVFCGQLPTTDKSD